MYLSQPNVSNPCKWRGKVCFIEEESQGFLEKPQEWVKASQRSLTKRVKLLEEARPKGSSFLKKLDKRGKILLEAKQNEQIILKKTHKRLKVPEERSSASQLAQLCCTQEGQKEEGRPTSSGGRPTTYPGRPARVQKD